MHRFYHADRYRTLSEGARLQLNDAGLSRFGSVYWPAVAQKSRESLTDAGMRELLLEEIRSTTPAFVTRLPRFRSFFATNTIEEAVTYARTIEPVPTHDIPIYEIFAERFWTFDSNWLDYSAPLERRIEYYKSYWYAEISNHCPARGERRIPRLEVQLELPVIVGQLVATARTEA